MCASHYVRYIRQYLFILCNRFSLSLIYKMLFLLLLNIMLRLATVIGIPPNRTLPNKTLIIRSAVDNLNDNLEDAKNLDELFLHMDLPTTEPSDFLENFQFSRLDEVTDTPLLDPKLSIPTILYDKSETEELPSTIGFEIDMTYHFTTPKLPMHPYRVFTRSTYFDPVTVDYDFYWKKYSKGMRNPVREVETYTGTTEFTNPEQSRSYISTSNTPITAKTTTVYIYQSSKLYLVTTKETTPTYELIDMLPEIPDTTPGA